MNYLKSFALLTVALLWGQLLLAQPGMHPPHRPPAPDLEKWTEVLELNEAQRAQLEQIFTDTRKKMEALREQSFENPAERREAIRPVLEAQREKIGQVLTEEQLEKLQTLRPDRKDRPRLNQEDREKMKRELRAYRETEMLPILRAQRQKLEARISPTDREKIADLRAALAQIHADHPQLEHKRQGQRPSEEDREARQAHRAEVKALMETYGAEIKSLLEEIKPQSEQWHKDLQAIHEKYAPEGRSRHSRQHPGKIRRGPRSEAGPDAGARMHGVHFLLMDPEVETSGEVDGVQGIDTGAYPNPAAALTTINYSVSQPGQIQIVLRNKSGNLNRVLLSAYRESGDYTHDVNLGDLQGGVYYYTVQNAASGQVVTKQLVVHK